MVYLYIHGCHAFLCIPRTAAVISISYDINGSGNDVYCGFGFELNTEPRVAFTDSPIYYDPDD